MATSITPKTDNSGQLASTHPPYSLNQSDANAGLKAGLDTPGGHFPGEYPLTPSTILSGSVVGNDTSIVSKFKEYFGPADSTANDHSESSFPRTEHQGSHLNEADGVGSSKNEEAVVAPPSNEKVESTSEGIREQTLPESEAITSPNEAPIPPLATMTVNATPTQQHILDDLELPSSANVDDPPTKAVDHDSEYQANRNINKVVDIPDPGETTQIPETELKGIPEQSPQESEATTSPQAHSAGPVLPLAAMTVNASPTQRHLLGDLDFSSSAILDGASTKAIFGDSVHALDSTTAEDGVPDPHQSIQIPDTEQKNSTHTKSPSSTDSGSDIPEKKKSGFISKIKSGVRKVVHHRPGV